MTRNNSFPMARVKGDAKIKSGGCGVPNPTDLYVYVNKQCYSGTHYGNMKKRKKECPAE